MTSSGKVNVYTRLTVVKSDSWSRYDIVRIPVLLHHVAIATTSRMHAVLVAYSPTVTDIIIHAVTLSRLSDTLSICEFVNIHTLIMDVQ